MRQIKAITFAAVGVLALSSITGCASIVRSGSQQIPVRSTPTDSTVYVDGEEVGTTPMDLDLERKDEHVIIVTRDGFTPSTTKLHKEISYITAGNIIFGLAGLIGTTVDMSTGSAYILKPSKVEPTLLRDSGVSADTVTN